MRISDWSSDVCSSDLRWSTIRPGRKESGQRRLSGTAIKGVMRERQFPTFYQRLNVSRHGIRRHDHRGVERMDIAAGDRYCRIAEQRCDRDLSEAEIVGHAGESVSKDKGRYGLKSLNL